jgi:hypothetical protein
MSEIALLKINTKIMLFHDVMRYGLIYRYISDYMASHLRKPSSIIMVKSQTNITPVTEGFRCSILRCFNNFCKTLWHDNILSFSIKIFLKQFTHSS